MKAIPLLFPVVVLAACSHASVSTVPVELPGIGTVYRYQGRANFAHQFAKADRLMIEQCKNVNGGRPVVVTQQMRDLGMVAMGNSQSTTNLNATGNRSGQTTYVQGTANTSTFGSAGAMRNMNQEILFKCVAP